MDKSISSSCFRSVNTIDGQTPQDSLNQGWTVGPLSVRAQYLDSPSDRTMSMSTSSPSNHCSMRTDVATTCADLMPETLLVERPNGTPPTLTVSRNSVTISVQTSSISSTQPTFMTPCEAAPDTGFMIAGNLTTSAAMSRSFLELMRKVRGVGNFARRRQSRVACLSLAMAMAAGSCPGNPNSWHNLATIGPDMSTKVTMPSAFPVIPSSPRVLRTSKHSSTIWSVVPLMSTWMNLLMIPSFKRLSAHEPSFSSTTVLMPRAWQRSKTNLFPEYPAQMKTIVEPLTRQRRRSWASRPSARTFRSKKLLRDFSWMVKAVSGAGSCTPRCCAGTTTCFSSSQTVSSDSSCWS
mmetsp:Transcript_1366/g.3040  ORF Transcript_1366/g.3040 Transcript_1366/m.3040 type:complete len:350 (+) Transcript_1366:1013-2062(+)